MTGGARGQCPLLSVPCLSLVLRNQSHKLNHASACITFPRISSFLIGSPRPKSGERNVTCRIPSNSKWLRQIFQGQDTFLMPLKLYPALVLLILSPDTLKPSPFLGQTEVRLPWIWANTHCHLVSLQKGKEETDTLCLLSNNSLQQSHNRCHQLQYMQ